MYDKEGIECDKDEIDNDKCLIFITQKTTQGHKESNKKLLKITAPPKELFQEGLYAIV